MILQSLAEYYERKKNEMPPYGFAEVKIPFTIVIDCDGRFIQLEKNSDTNAAGKSEVREFCVPKARARTGSKSYETANYLWDHYGYVLGQPSSKKLEKRGDKAVEMAERQHQSFRNLVKKIRENLSSEIGVIAVDRFVNSKEEVEKVTATGLWSECAEIEGCNIALRLANETSLICQSPAIIDWVSSQPSSVGDTREGLCLITGQTEQVVRLHHNVSGVCEKPSPLAAINNSAYNSYGKDKGFNFPVSVEASYQYATALNHLLRKKSRKKFQILKTSYVCWSEKGSNLEEWMPAIMRSDDYDESVEAVKHLYSSIQNGAYQLDNGNARFYLLGLAPNSVRVMVRFWQVGTVAQFSENIAKWFEDIKVDGSEKFGHPPLNKLLESTAHLNKDKNVPPNLPSAVVTAILNNTPLPNSLMQGVIRRINSDKVTFHEPSGQNQTDEVIRRINSDKVTFLRASLIKAYINRLPNNTGEITMSLNLEEKRVGYCLGRLFAILEKLQQDANPGINSTIKDRYYSSASCAPKSVFCTLLRLSNHHLKKLEHKSWQVAAEKRIGEIMELISEFPSHLNLEDQGLFAIGYYHQKQDLYTKSE